MEIYHFMVSWVYIYIYIYKHSLFIFSYILRFGIFYIRICVGLWSVCCRFVIGLSSGLSVCCRLRFQHCANDRFSIGFISVIYRSQIGRFHTESYPKWPRHEPDWFYGVFNNIVSGRQLADSLKTLRFLSVSCRFGRCDWGIRQRLYLTVKSHEHHDISNHGHLNCLYNNMSSPTRKKSSELLTLNVANPSAHYTDIIMGMLASQITSFTIVY